MKQSKKSWKRWLFLSFLLVVGIGVMPNESVAEEQIPVDAVHFPDTVFRQYIEENIDLNQDGKLSQAECHEVTAIDVKKKAETPASEKVASFQGIAYFPNVALLDCSYNRVTDLDMGANAELMTLRCPFNEINALNLPSNGKLQQLDCSGNHLKVLDLKNNVGLNDIRCLWNALTTLDLSNMPALEIIDCSGNKLTTLVISDSPNLQMLALKENAVTQLDLSGLPGLKQLFCSRNQLTALDVGRNPALEVLDAAFNQIPQIDLRHNAKLTSIGIGHNKLERLDVSANKNMVDLECCSNALKELNITGLTELKSLQCMGNQLTKLDVSNSPYLDMLSCGFNKLTELDLSNNRALTELRCECNHLTSLNAGLELNKINCSGNQYEVFQRTNIDYTKFPGAFDENRVSNVRNGSLDQQKHVFNMDADVDVLTYDYDTGNGKVEFQIICRQMAPTPTNSFIDVNASDYFYEAVQWAVEKGITNGTSENTFSPNKSCLRGQAVTFLWNKAGRPKPVSNNNPFVDVHPSDYYYDAVLWAVENNIAAGMSENTFMPNATCNRAQIVTFMWRQAGQPSVTLNNAFTDVHADAYYAQAVQWAVNQGITKGINKTTFGAEEKCTRGQIVTFLYRAK